jgi:hypothetical protein
LIAVTDDIDASMHEQTAREKRRGANTVPEIEAGCTFGQHPVRSVARVKNDPIV